jgi:hypothetical protein
MPAGLTIYNDSGTVQIDENYKNLAFKEKRAVSLSHSFGNVYIDVTVAGFVVAMAMQSAHYAPFLLATEFDGTNWTYHWGFTYLGMGEPTSDTAYAFIFDAPSANPDNFGLEVYDDAGGLVYHSGIQALKIVAVQGHTTTFTGTSGRDYVPLILEANTYSAMVGPGFVNFTQALRASGNSITAIEVATSPGTSISVGGLYAAVDVTGYT